MLSRVACIHAYRGGVNCVKCGHCMADDEDEWDPEYNDGPPTKAGASRRALTAAEMRNGPFGAGRALPGRISRHGGLAWYLLTDKDGRWVCAELGGACYYSLADMIPEHRKRAHYIVDWPFVESGAGAEAGWRVAAWNRVGKETGWASQWFTWMANKSPWAHIFVTKTWKAAWTAGVVYRTDVAPAEHVITAMSGIRYIGESPRVPMTWARFREVGADPLLALLAAHHGVVDKKGMISSGEFCSNHAMWYIGAFLPRFHVPQMLSGKLTATQPQPMQQKWRWDQCIRQFDKEGVDRGYRRDTPQDKLKLPATGARYEKDMFGQIYQVSGTMEPAQWLAEFQKEVNKWLPQST